MKAIDICNKNITQSKTKNKGDKDRIKQDYPEVQEWAKDITDAFGPYIACRVSVDGKQIYKWGKK